MIQPSQADYKADYEKYVAKAMTLIHAPETRDSILNLLKGSNPVQRVAKASVMIMQRLDVAARESQIEVQDTVKIFGANEIVNLIVEYGEAAGVFKLDKDLVELALSTTVQDYVKGEIAAKRIDPQKIKIAMQADIRKLSPKQRKEIQQSQVRIQETARKYNNGQGMMKAA